MPAQRPRYLPELPLPPYTYIPGRAPHPLTDPRGHMFGTADEVPALPDAGHWRSCRDFLRGVDLFNHGYYWEAHEAWERLWIAAGRKGVAADFLKGLIKLAAAGVKLREGNRAGAKRHLSRAAQLFQQTIDSRGDAPFDDFGLDPRQLLHWSALPAPDAVPLPGGDVAVVFQFLLAPAI